MNELRRKLNKMPFDRKFGGYMGADGTWYHATGYEVCFDNPNEPGNWWNEYINDNGDIEYGR